MTLPILLTGTVILIFISPFIGAALIAGWIVLGGLITKTLEKLFG